MYEIYFNGTNFTSENVRNKIPKFENSIPSSSQQEEIEQKKKKKKKRKNLEIFN